MAAGHVLQAAVLERGVVERRSSTSGAPSARCGSSTNNPGATPPRRRAWQACRTADRARIGRIPRAAAKRRRATPDSKGCRVSPGRDAPRAQCMKEDGARVGRLVRVELVEKLVLRVIRIGERRQIRTQRFDLRVRQERHTGQVTVLVEKGDAIGRKCVTCPIVLCRYPIEERADGLVALGEIADHTEIVPHQRAGERSAIIAGPMSLTALDWFIVAAYFLLTVAIGLYYFDRAGQSVGEFFLSGRNFPWWLAGTSMVATTFAADTPLAVAGIVARDGVAGNWIWWNAAIGGMLTVFFFARLWRRAGIMTDVEFAELRYSGCQRPSSAAFARSTSRFRSTAPSWVGSTSRWPKCSW